MFYLGFFENVEKKIDSNIIKFFNDIFIYNFIFIKMMRKYYFKLVTIYKKNKKEFKILKSLKTEKKRLKNKK